MPMLDAIVKSSGASIPPGTNKFTVVSYAHRFTILEANTATIFPRGGNCHVMLLLDMAEVQARVVIDGPKIIKMSFLVDEIMFLF